jgi:hypothetical protein
LQMTVCFAVLNLWAAFSLQYCQDLLNEVPAECVRS